ncbi:MAG: phosphatase PAP2 family protein [Bacteroidaceae bacterium]|nr:phosphatase PAP2 family protein [Bacteroidaceae bacterium]
MRSLLFFFLMVSTCCLAQEETDTLYTSSHGSNERFNARQLIAPGVLMTSGALVAGTNLGQRFQKEVRNDMNELRGSHYFHADDYLQYAPVTAYAALGLCGVPCKHNIKERLLVGATAYLVMTGLTNGLKYSIRERRPDSASRNSFPSGHTATAFTGAELVREEYGLGIGIAAYGIASGVAFLRLYNERHWVGDVLFGAGIGILSARIGYWMLPVYQKWFKMPMTNGTQIAALPFYQTDTRSLGANVVILL